MERCLVRSESRSVGVRSSGVSESYESGVELPGVGALGLGIVSQVTEVLLDFCLRDKST